jgi:DNA-binding transcriptional ArsR family regulator
VTTNQLDVAWAALADGTRRSIVRRLADGPLAVSELAAELPVTRSAVSQHLKVLKEAGLVTERAAGTRRIYRVEVGGVAALRDELDSVWRHALSRYADIVESAAAAGAEPAADNNVTTEKPLTVDNPLTAENLE